MLKFTQVTLKNKRLLIRLFCSNPLVGGGRLQRRFSKEKPSGGVQVMQPMSYKIRSIQDLMPDTYKTVQEYKAKPTKDSLVEFIRRQQFDFNLRDSIILIGSWVDLSTGELWKVTKADRETIMELIQNLKYCLQDAINLQPFISEDFAQKMNDMSQKQYEEYLENFTEKYLEEGANYELKYPRIGELARCLGVLKIDDRELWELIMMYFDKGRYRPNLNDSISALEGLRFYRDNVKAKPSKALPAKASAGIAVAENTTRLAGVIKKMEYNIDKLVWYETMPQFHRILTALASLECYENKNLYDKLELNMLSNLNSDYTADLMIDIGHKFVLAGHGGPQLFQYLQTIVANGHMFNNGGLLRYFKKTSPFTVTPAALVKIVDTYVYANARHPKALLVLPDFKVLMFKAIKRACHHEGTYMTLAQISSLVSGVRTALDLEKSEIAEITVVLADKAVASLNKQQSLDDLNSFFLTCALLYFGKQSMLSFLAKLDEKWAQKTIDIGSPDELFVFANIMMENRLLVSNRSDLLEGIIKDYIKANPGKVRHQIGSRLAQAVKLLQASGDTAKEIGFKEGDGTPSAASSLKIG